jgi:hypothetical protein
MQSSQVQTRQQAERSNRIEYVLRKGKDSFPFLFILTVISALLLAGPLSAAEKAEKKPRKAPVARESAVNDANVQESLKKAEDQLKKGETDSSVAVLLKIHDYSEDVLKTVKFFHTQYEKVVNDSSVSQAEREDIFLKLKRMDQLTKKYTAIRETSAYDLGYGYAKKGDGERSRKYLLEVLETAPFSTRPESLWMKSKKILLWLYSLEGEF